MECCILSIFLSLGQLVHSWESEIDHQIIGLQNEVIKTPKMTQGHCCGQCWTLGYHSTAWSTSEQEPAIKGKFNFIMAENMKGRGKVWWYMALY